MDSFVTLTEIISSPVEVRRYVVILFFVILVHFIVIWWVETIVKSLWRH